MFLAENDETAAVGVVLQGALEDVTVDGREKAAYAGGLEFFGDVIGDGQGVVAHAGF